ncbi:MAG: hypothetical protein K2L12_00340, partial [Clostridia bacterium]|nr:hypothetical protein [Clostridia bacterium]
KTFTCTVNGCGETKTEPVAANGHSWNNGEITKQPTETTAGVKTFTCTVNGCGATKTQPVPELGHKHSYTGEWQKDGDGHWKVCDGANCVETDYQDEHDWDDGEVTTSATCSAQGVKTFTCETCGYEKTEPVPVNATAHGWGDWTEKTPATCTAAKVEERVCLHNSTHTETQTVGAPLGHSWDDGEITTPATCSAEGVKTFTCETCGSEKTETVSVVATAHSWGDWTEKTPATCTTAKVEERVCSHNSEHTETRIGEALGHDWSNDWNVDWTEEEGGQATKTCAFDGCSENKTVTLPAYSEDDYEIIDTANCTTAGKLSWVYTTADDGQITVKQEESPAKGHNFGAYKKIPTSTGQPAGAGKLTRSCMNESCSEEESKDFAANNNNTSGSTGNGNLAVKDGNTYYVYFEKFTAAKSAVLTLSSPNEGIYEYNFEYLSDEEFVLNTNTTSRVSGGMYIEAGGTYGYQVKSDFTDRIILEYKEGRLTKVTFKVGNAEDKIVAAGVQIKLGFKTAVTSGEYAGILASINYIPPTDLKVGQNKVKITAADMEADTSSDNYTFTPAESKKYSLTVP